MPSQVPVIPIGAYPTDAMHGQHRLNCTHIWHRQNMSACLVSFSCSSRVDRTQRSSKKRWYNVRRVNVRVPRSLTTTWITCVQCESMEAVVRRLKELGIKYVERQVEEGGIFVDQIFFHDPDGFMIEVCTCDNLPIVPLAPEGYAPLGMSPACIPTTTTPSPPPSQCVPAMASGSSYVGEVEAMRSCPEHACMQV
jgi:hypothetical protein